MDSCSYRDLSPLLSPFPNSVDPQANPQFPPYDELQISADGHPHQPCGGANPGDVGCSRARRGQPRAPAEREHNGAGGRRRPPSTSKCALGVGGKKCGGQQLCCVRKEHLHHSCMLQPNDVALERDVEGDVMLGDMGQWLCYADKSSHEPRLRLKAFFGSLYRCLARGARAVLQLYAENMDQSEMIMTYAMRAGFAGGVVVDWPHSSKARKAYLVLTCGPSLTNTSLPKGKGEDGEMCSDSDESGHDDESQTVGIYDRNRPRKKLKVTKKGKGKEWVLKKKEQMRNKGHNVPRDTKYTARKRKTRF